MYVPVNEPLTVNRVLTRVIEPVTAPLVLTTCGFKVTVKDAEVIWAVFPFTSILLLVTCSPLNVSV